MLTNSGCACRDCEGSGHLTSTELNVSLNISEWNKLILENKIRPLSPAGYLGTAIYLTVIGLLATIGNVLVLVVFYKHRKLRRNPHNLLLLNLVISDLGISVLFYPLTTSSNYAGRYLYGKVGCVIQGFMTFTLAQTDMNTLACLSVYRFISVCMPGDVHRLTRSVTIKVIVFLWVYSLLWTVPPLLGWSAYTYEPFGTSCSIDWDDRESGAVAYTWCLIVYCYLLHIVIIVYCYYKIAKKARDVHSRLKHFTIGGICNSDSMCLRRVQMERKSSLMSVLLTVTFIVLWSPYAFVCLWSVYNPNLPNWITTWPTMFAKFSCTLNPFLYFMTHPTFKRHVMALFPQGGDPPQRSCQEMRPLGASRLFAADRNKDGVYQGKEHRLPNIASRLFAADRNKDGVYQGKEHRLPNIASRLFAADRNKDGVYQGKEHRLPNM